MQTFCDLNKYSLLLRRFTFKTHINIIKSKNKRKNMEESTETYESDTKSLRANLRLIYEHIKEYNGVLSEGHFIALTLLCVEARAIADELKSIKNEIKNITRFM